MLILAALTLAFWLLLSIDWFLGMRRLPHLRAPPPEGTPGLPTLTVIVPVLNEEATIEAGLETVLAQDYPRLEVIVVNDRSSDRTGEIIERVRRRHPGLEVVHLTGLPEGWLGKNHALHLGAQRARGEWLLFTDADVQFEPHALSAALAHAVQNDLDHLTAVPHMMAKSLWLKAFISSFMLLFSFGVLRASAPATKAHVGLGAFNLLRRSVYEAVGGHRPIALRPDDDMMLGKLVKSAGYEQAVVLAPELLRVEWYTGVREAIRGLNKNAFAGLAYSLPIVLLVTLTLALTHVLPFVAVFFTEGLTRTLLLLVLLVIAFDYVLGRRMTRLPVWYVLLHPVGTGVVIYAILESAAKALWRGGISWRGTFYPLEQLRKNRL